MTSLPISTLPGLAADRPPVAPIDTGRLEEIFGATMTSRTREIVAAAPPGLRAALILGSPEFMRR